MCSSHLSIAIQEPNTSGYTFRTFNAYLELRAWHLSVPDSSHYEVIEGRQNLYFDFDGDIDIQVLTEAIKRYYAELERTHDRSLPIRVDIYSSSDSVKKSFHVVVKGVCFRDHISCGQAARETISLSTNSPDKEGKSSAFDASVYTVKRNLRLLGSRKINSTRVKVFVGTSYKSPTFASRFENDQLFLSLVSATSECQLVLLSRPVEKPYLRDMPQLSGDMVRDALQLVNDLLPGVFSLRELRGNTVFLKRNKPAICPICERLHESDNAMVSLRNRGGPILHFVCMRDTSRSLPLQSDEEVVLPLIGGAVAVPVVATTIESYDARVVRKWGFTS
jgi:hypothetical protein